MPQFMVERHLPDLPPDRLPAAAAAAKQNSPELSSEGMDVRYIRSTYIPDGKKCHCLFEGSSREAVAEVQRPGKPALREDPRGRFPDRRQALITGAPTQWMHAISNSAI